MKKFMWFTFATLIGVACWIGELWFPNLGLLFEEICFLGALLGSFLGLFGMASSDPEEGHKSAATVNVFLSLLGQQICLGLLVLFNPAEENLPVILLFGIPMLVLTFTALVYTCNCLFYVYPIMDKWSADRRAKEMEFAFRQKYHIPGRTISITGSGENAWFTVKDIDGNIIESRAWQD